MTDLDIGILYWLQDHVVCSFLTPLMKTVTTMGNGGIFWILMCLILMIPKSTRKIGMIAALSLAFVAIFNNLILKNIVARPRPFTYADIELLIAAPKGYSFPSGHAASSFATATAVFLGNKRVGAIALVLAALVAFSRMYFFVHFPSDVLVGSLEGILAAIVISKIVDYAMKKQDSTSGKL
ncbi:MAG TPA: phosphatase PAP2 family protein [Clostridiales bacterium]|nr:phosphatase PAP2 family protein [Clostridiales bacterium]